ncbi:MAG: pilus assembly protein N-terminal domain-containing protein [Deltaproteobacteria bacterium]|nr:pilus assembly protein N-terminal domain-containing protein [Deltaproteobacteria bacterium]
MRNLIKILFSFIFISEISFTYAAELNKGANKEIFAVKDIPQTITVDYDIGEIAVGNPAIASVVADRPRRRIVLSPLEPGETALLIFDVGGRQRDNISITVTSTDLDTFVKDLKFLFRDIEGLSFRRVGRKVIIEGEVYLKSDLDRIHEVLKGNDFIVDLVTLSQDTQRILARRIKDEIGIQGVEVSTAKDRIVLKGEVLSEDEAARAEKIAQIYTDKASIVNAIAVNPKKSGARPAKLIQVSGYFVELNKAFLRNFNFSWTPIADVKIGYNYSGGRGDFVLSTLVTEFLPKLNMAKALGVARVFENPTVSVKSGEAAKISSGGQVFIPVPNQNGGTTFSQSPIETGVTLDVTATADDRDFVDMKLGIQVSKIGSGTTPNTIQVNKSNVNTVHYVRSGETVALGGVLRSAFSDIKDSPPDQPFSFAPAGSEGPSFTSSLGNIFQVFKSHSVTSDRTMFIVFITPEILGTGRDSGRRIREAMNLNGVEAYTPNAAEDFE